ncbi:MAG TPA: carbohydrate ABC transporter permease [Actinomycetota bacterium]|nr:carbohydrate ABC transporter permease [Actinomycetota bacterium]
MLLRSRARRLAWALGVIAVGLTFVMPLAAMLSGSFREPGLAPPTGLELVPLEAGTESYERAVSLVPLARAVGNSLFVAVAFTVVAVLSASWAGFGLTLASPRTRRRVVVLLVVVLMVPVSAVWLGRFAILHAAGLTDTFFPLVLPALVGGSPLFVLLYFLAFRRIPRDVIDAARLEGAGAWATWRRVAMPLVRGTTIAVALLAFAISWANFIDPLLYLSDERLHTAPLVLRSLEQLGPTNWPVLLAGAVLVTAPVLLASAGALRLIVPRRGPGWLGG